ncbi:MAG: hypothetical protein ACOX9R_15285 [Armatimonadota bacterium]|jgi:uncharacterized protein YpuA (DUF1002 family)
MDRRELTRIENIKIEDVVVDAVGDVTAAVAGVIGTLLEKRDDTKAHLEEIKDNIVERLATQKDLTQEKYEEVVETVISEYTAAKKISGDQADELEARLRDGYEAVRQTIHEHTAPGDSPTTA